jgi:hypothetical protein
LRIVAPLLSKLQTITPWTTDTVWPAQGADGLKTFGVIDEGLYVYHGGCNEMDPPLDGWALRSHNG